MYFLLLLISGLLVPLCFNGKLDDWGLFLLTSKQYIREWFAYVSD